MFSWDQRDQARALNLGLLHTLRKFMQPLEGRTLIAGHTKATILRLLQVVP